MVRTKNLAFAIAISAALAALVFQPAEAKTKAHKRQTSNQHRYGNYLIPPPPAYTPSILPELQATAGAEPPKPVNPYKKYVYTREGHDEPPPVQPNKYVTYWNKKS